MEPIIPVRRPMQIHSHAGLFARSDTLARAAPRDRVPPRTRALPILATAALVAGLWAAASTYYLVFHDEILARFVAEQSALRQAYEERVGALQAQLDRAATDRLLQGYGAEERLTALAARQVALERRQGLLSELSGIAPAPPPAAPEDAPAVAPAPKPFPTPVAPGRDERADLSRGVAGLKDRLDRIAAEQGRVLDRLAERAAREADRLRGLIAGAGLDPERFAPAPSGLGGPLVPLDGDAFDTALAQARRAIGEEERLRRTALALPFRAPIAGPADLSSQFGARLDPFTRGLALHTGLDFRAEHGTPARATAAGRVVTAEATGGYGNLIEIDHGQGIVTRYAHLSSFAVAQGQPVEAGAIVGRVGSTGRSTGNHLHYETRIDGEPVDPQRFMQAGAGLAALTSP